MAYAPVKDDPVGPSRVKPSGRKGSSLETRRGVVRRKAKQIHRRKVLKFPARPRECVKEELVTDLLKKVASDVDQGLRAVTPLSAKEEVRLGNTLHKGLGTQKKFAGRIDTRKTRKWRAYLARVAQPLLAEVSHSPFTYKFHVIDLPEVNAFVLPGGHVYVYTGLLTNRGGTWIANEAELAGILAHEIAHVDLGHPAAIYHYLKRFGLVGKRGEKPGTIALAMARHSFSSAQEDAADRQSVSYMLAAQYSPAATVALWRRWAKRLPARPQGERGDLSTELRNLLRTHSSPRERICTVMLATNEHLGRYNFDRWYVGKSNFRKRRARTSRQW
jgi:beta-barrel assembly-enhancing protease